MSALTRLEQQVALVEKLGRPRLLVLGDLILDRYTWGDADRISPEAPVLVLQADRQEARLGGAASVCYLARGLDCDVAAAGVTGEDTNGPLLQKLLAESGISIEGVYTDTSRKTTTKERFIGRAANRHPQQILRVDHEDRVVLNAKMETAICESITQSLSEANAFLISDYAKGACTTQVLRHGIAAANDRNVPVIVDPGRQADYTAYQGAALVTPNRRETELATGMTVRTLEDAARAGLSICERFGIAAAIVTLDRDGMMLVSSDGRTEHFSTQPREVYDITGAGDMVLAMLGLCLAEGLTPAEAIPLANSAAGLEVERVGVEQIRRDEILGDLLSGQSGHGKVVAADELELLGESIRKRGQTCVFTNGCFDILHRGHIRCLREAAAMGDILFVGLNSDESVQRLKGPERPVNPQADRAEVLAALGCVDYVVIFDEDTPIETLRRLKPDVLVKGGTYRNDEVVGREIVEAYGGEVRVTGQIENISTTRIIDAVRQKPGR